MDAPVDLEFKEGVAWITLNRPEAGNALEAELVGALGVTVRAARDADVGVVVLRSSASEFCVGGDLKAFYSAGDTPGYIDDLAEALHRTVSDIIRLDAIVVASVNGVAAGAGVPLAATADIVIAAESARFIMAYTRVGLPPDGGSSLLTASLGLHRALYLALLNPVLTAQEARSAGLVMEVHPDDKLDEAVADVVQRLSMGSRDAQVAAKRLIRGQAVPAPETAMRRESMAIRSAATGLDGREGISAFLAKRKPEFPSSRAGSASSAADPASSAADPASSDRS